LSFRPRYPVAMESSGDMADEGALVAEAEPKS
jgi:hypothetical protein